MKDIPVNYKLAYQQGFIEERIRLAARDLDAYSRFILQSTGKPPIFLCVLEGGLFFYSELLKHIPSNQVETAFYRVATYDGKQKTVSQTRQTSLGVDLLSIRGRTIILVDDILDTGDTLSRIHDRLTVGEPHTIRAAVLIHRVRENNYLAFDVHTYRAIEHKGEEWFVGYGMDDNGLNRNLLDIYIKEK